MEFGALFCIEFVLRIVFLLHLLLAMRRSKKPLSFFFFTFSSLFLWDSLSYDVLRRTAFLFCSFCCFVTLCRLLFVLCLRSLCRSSYVFYLRIAVLQQRLQGATVRMDALSPCRGTFLLKKRKVHKRKPGRLYYRGLSSGIETPLGGRLSPHVTPIIQTTRTSDYYQD